MGRTWGSTTSNRRRNVRLIILFCWLAVLAALVISESIGSARVFWTDHPITAGLVTSFVTLALTALLLDEILRERDRQRWSKFVVLSYRALAQEAEDVRFKLQQYVHGRSARQDIAAECDEDLLSGARPAIARLGTAGADDERIILAALADDLDWTRSTYVGIRAIKRQNWDSLFRLAPILVAHSDTAEVLNRFSALNESLVRLERLFEEYAQTQWLRRPRPTWSTEVATQWIDVIKLAITLENGLHLSVTQLDWVTQEDLDALLERYDSPH